MLSYNQFYSYYIGFNKWSTSIVSLVAENLEYDEATNHFRCTYTCRIRFDFEDGRSIEASGKATGGAKEKSTVIEFAKKNAVTDAHKNSFKRLAMIVLFLAANLMLTTLDTW